MEQAVIAPARGDSEVKSKPRRRRINWLPIWLILPTVLVLLAIQVYPVFYTIALSFQERKPSGWIYVGLRNFERLFGASAVRESIGHTVIFLVGYVALTLSLGFIIALLLNSRIKASGLFRGLMLIPWTIPSVVVAILWRWMLPTCSSAACTCDKLVAFGASLSTCLSAVFFSIQCSGSRTLPPLSVPRSALI